MADINLIALGGRLTADPVLRTEKILTFTIANNRSERNQQGVYEDVASFFDCEILGERASKLAPYLHKGSDVVVTGEALQHVWEDKKTQTNRRRDVVRVATIKLPPLPPKNTTNQNVNVPQQQYAPQQVAQPAPQPAPQPTVESYEELSAEDVPF